MTQPQGTSTMPTDTPPCDLCGTLGGPSIAGQHRHKPSRYRGEPYGLEGLICRECRDDLVDEEIDRRAMAMDVAGRAEAVGRAKADKLRRGRYGCGYADLSPAELDRVLPPGNRRPRGGQFPFGAAAG